MPLPPWHKLTLTTATPAFLGRFGDPDQTGDRIPFPVPSLRGALAYWLRALAGAHLGNHLPSLRRAESAVFGAARSGESGGPSTIWLRGPLIGVSTFQAGNDGLGYLLGPGLRGTDGPPPRYLRPGTQIGLEIRNTGSPVHADLFLSCVWALRTFGGIGARARRGFGTVRVDRPMSVPCDRFQADWLHRNSAEDLDDVLTCVAESLTELGIPHRADDGSQPAYPKFDLPGRWYLLGPDITVPAASYDDALIWTGDRLREFRHDGDAERSTESFRQIVRPFLAGESFTGEYRAGALGLPVVYTTRPVKPGDEKHSATVEPVVAGQPSRRASPLWLRVHGKPGTRGAPGTWWLRSLAFDATWLPRDGAQLQIKDTSGGARRSSEPVEWPSPGLIRQELDRWFTYLSPGDADAHAD